MTSQERELNFSLIDEIIEEEDAIIANYTLLSEEFMKKEKEKKEKLKDKTKQMTF